MYTNIVLAYPDRYAFAVDRDLIDKTQHMFGYWLVQIGRTKHIVLFGIHRYKSHVVVIDAEQVGCAPSHHHHHSSVYGEERDWARHQ